MSSISSVFIQPLEVIKVNMQLCEIGSKKKLCCKGVSIAKDIVRREGFQAIFRGGSAQIFKTIFTFFPHHILTCHVLEQDKNAG